MGVPKTIGSDIPNFVKDVPRVPKCVPRWASAPNHILMGSKMKSWTIHVQMGNLEAIGYVRNLRLIQTMVITLEGGWGGK